MFRVAGGRHLLSAMCYLLWRMLDNKRNYKDLCWKEQKLSMMKINRMFSYHLGEFWDDTKWYWETGYWEYLICDTWDIWYWEPLICFVWNTDFLGRYFGGDRRTVTVIHYPTATGKTQMSSNKKKKKKMHKKMVFSVFLILYCLLLLWLKWHTTYIECYRGFFFF